MRRLLEVSANIAIVTVAVVIVGNFVWPKIWPKRNITGPTVGSSITLAGVNWKENGGTVLMVLQKGCRYCEESASFNRRLHDQRVGKEPAMLAVIPGEATDTARYLSDQGILADANF